MRHHRPSISRGHVQHGWLDTYHTFSFAHFVDPKWMGFGPLRVINEDRIDGRQGFGRHFHDNMEIITLVLSGTLEHGDSMGNTGRITAGMAQYMSAGRGVLHSEVNPESEPVHLFQIWILPNVLGAEPRYEERQLGTHPPGSLQVIASADGRDGSMEIRQDAELLRGTFFAGDTLAFNPRYAGKQWLHVVRGELHIGDDVLRAGDAVGIEDEPVIGITAVTDAELLVFDMIA